MPLASSLSLARRTSSCSRQGHASKLSLPLKPKHLSTKSLIFGQAQSAPSTTAQVRSQRVDMVSLRVLALAVPSLAAALLLAAHAQGVAGDLQEPQQLQLHQRWLYDFDGNDERFHKRQGPGSSNSAGDGSGNGGVTVSLPVTRGSSSTTLPPIDSSSSTTVSTAVSSSPPETSRDQSTAISTGATTTAVSTPPSSIVTTESTPSSIPSTSSTISSAESSSSQTSLAVSTVIITTTADNGSVLTSASISSAPPTDTSAADQNGGAGGESNSKKWIIPLSVVGKQEWRIFVLIRVD